MLIVRVMTSGLGVVEWEQPDFVAEKITALSEVKQREIHRLLELELQGLVYLLRDALYLGVDAPKAIRLIGRERRKIAHLLNKMGT